MNYGEATEEGGVTTADPLKKKRKLLSSTQKNISRDNDNVYNNESSCHSNKDAACGGVDSFSNRDKNNIEGLDPFVSNSSSTTTTTRNNNYTNNNTSSNIISDNNKSDGINPPLPSTTTLVSSTNQTSTLSKKKREYVKKSAKKKTSSGTWSDEEHLLFEKGIQLHGWGNWKMVAEVVQTRDNGQCRSHAQKYKSLAQKYAKVVPTRDASQIQTEAKKIQEKMKDIQYQAIQSFMPDKSESNQISFQVGDMISVNPLHLSRTTNGWILGRNARTLDYGWYPLSFLKKIEKEHALKKCEEKKKAAGGVTLAEAAALGCIKCKDELATGEKSRRVHSDHCPRKRKSMSSTDPRKIRSMARAIAKRKKENEEKATELVASLSPSDREVAENAAKSWNFEKNIFVEGQSSVFNSALETLKKNMPDAGNIALVIRKLGKPDEKIHRFKNHDSLFKLDCRVRTIFIQAEKVCLVPVYDEKSRIKCTPKEACRRAELMYQRLGFADAKERALKGLEDSKHMNHFADF